MEHGKNIPSKIRRSVNEVNSPLSVEEIFSFPIQTGLKFLNIHMFFTAASIMISWVIRRRMKYMRGERDKNQLLIEGLFCASSLFSAKGLSRTIHYPLYKLVQNTYCVPGMYSVSDEMESMSKRASPRPINHLYIKMSLWVGKLADYHLVLPVLWLLSVFSVLEGDCKEYGPKG